MAKKRVSLMKGGTRFLILATFVVILIYQSKLSDFLRLRSSMRQVVANGQRISRNSSAGIRINASDKDPGAIPNWHRRTQKTILIWNIPFNDITMAAEYLFVDPYPSDLNK